MIKEINIPAKTDLQREERIAFLLKKCVGETAKDREVKRVLGEAFRPDDRLGRVWYRLREESSRMGLAIDDKRDALFYYWQGFAAVANTLGGLWLFERKFKNEFVSDSFPIAETEIEAIEANFSLYGQDVTRYLSKPDYLPSIAAGFLRDQVETKYCNLWREWEPKAYPWISRQVRFGMELGWGRWRELAGNA